ncbi:MAG: hypothetical protein QNJ70_27215 [Xenococcaceae cyanobacterium MO_207.B15]|nr:hypothetical protein [Xenococcaceae cyanobacterium MO_207.B15]
MSDKGIIQFIFGLDEPELEDEERLKFAKKLLRELRNLDEVERADRTEDLDLEAGSKPGFANLIGSITALVRVKNIKGFLGFLGDRLQDKPIKGSIKVGDNKIEFEVKSRQELAEFEKTALNLIAAMSGESNVKEGSSTDRG